MAIQSGIGVGEAQIYDTGGSLNTYARLMQKQQAQRQAEQKALQDQLSKISADGVREADKPKFYEKYEKAKSLFREASSLKGRAKMEKMAEFDSAIRETEDHGAQSKYEGKEDHTLGAMLYDPEKRNNFTDDAVTKIQRNFTLPIDDPNYVKDRTTFERRVDAIKVDERISKLVKNSLDSARWSSPIEEKATQGNRTGVDIYSRREIDPKEAFQLLLNEYDTSPDFEKVLKQKYGELPKPELIQAYAADKQATGMFREETKREFKENDNSFEKHVRQRQYDIANPLRDATPSENPTTSASSVDIPFADGKGVVRSNDYRGISIPKKNFVGSEYIDMATGKPAGKLESSSDYEIVGIGNFPVMKNMKAESGRNGSIAQPDFEKNAPNNVERKPMVHVQVSSVMGGKTLKENYLVPYDKLPINVRDSKSVKAALGGFQAAKNTTTNNSQSKTNNVSSSKTKPEDLRKKYNY